MFLRGFVAIDTFVVFCLFALFCSFLFVCFCLRALTVVKIGWTGPAKYVKVFTILVIAKTPHQNPPQAIRSLPWLVESDFDVFLFSYNNWTALKKPPHPLVSCYKGESFLVCLSSLLCFSIILLNYGYRWGYANRNGELTNPQSACNITVNCINNCIRWVMFPFFLRIRRRDGQRRGKRKRLVWTWRRSGQRWALDLSLMVLEPFPLIFAILYFPCAALSPCRFSFQVACNCQYVSQSFKK